MNYFHKALHPRCWIRYPDTTATQRCLNSQQLWKIRKNCFNLRRKISRLTSQTWEKSRSENCGKCNILQEHKDEKLILLNHPCKAILKVYLKLFLTLRLPLSIWLGFCSPRNIMSAEDRAPLFNWNKPSGYLNVLICSGV